MHERPMMTPYDVAKAWTSSFLTLDEEDLRLLASAVDKCQTVGKGEVFITDGMVCKHIIYIERGLERQFYYKNGRDVTEHFACEGRSLHCIESLYRQVPTHLMAEALEPCVLHYINYDSLCQLMGQSAGLRRFYRLFQEDHLVITQHKADSFRYESSVERYERFMRDYPDVARRAPLQHIASYLLMTPETLSRIRASL